MTNLVIHVPRASTLIPDDVLGQFQLPSDALAQEAEISADLFTDLLARAAWPQALFIEAEVSRIVVDVERYPDDELESMAEVGRGMVYQNAHDGRTMHRLISVEERRALRQKWFDPHWDRLREASADNTLIDLHSYPLVPWAVEPNQTGPRPEIDLGITEGLTPDGWVELLILHFERAGYEVGINSPYAGGNRHRC